MADDFYDNDDPYFAVCDRLDAGDSPKEVYGWATKRRNKAKNSDLREQWDEALRYIREEYPELKLH